MTAISFGTIEKQTKNNHAAFHPPLKLSVKQIKKGKKYSGPLD